MYPFSAGTDYRRHNLTSQVNPRTEQKILKMDVDPYIGIQMKRKYLTEAFVMISNCRKSFDIMVYVTIIQGFKGYCYRDYGEQYDM